MVKKVAIHQPNYLPWIGFFNKISKADCYVVLDRADFVKNSVLNRNKVKVGKDKWTYLTIPVSRKFYRTPLNDVLLPENNGWAENHLKTIEMHYSKAEFFSEHRDFFRETYENLPERFVELNEKIIRYLLNEFKIDVEIVRESELGIDPELKKTERLIEILKKVNADTYLSGDGASRRYLEEEKFGDIELEFVTFKHPKYNQLYGEHIEGMSSMDILFNEGFRAEKYVKGVENGM
jgi:hypothetical protein